MGSKIHIAAVAVVLALAPAAVARPAKDVTYGGKSSAKWPVMVQLSHDGRQVTYAVAAWTTHCTDGTASDSEEFAGIPLSASGRFAKSYDTGDVQEGSVSYRYAASIDGKLNKQRSKITGTVRVMSHYKDDTVDWTCDTGTVKYTAIN
jgi:hypothetical protein